MAPNKVLLYVFPLPMSPSYHLENEGHLYVPKGPGQVVQEGSQGS